MVAKLITGLTIATPELTDSLPLGREATTFRATLNAIKSLIGGGIQSILGDFNISIDNGDPANPVISTTKQLETITELFGNPTLSMIGNLPSMNLDAIRTQAQIATIDATPTQILPVFTANNSIVKITADILAIRTGGVSGSVADAFATKITGTFKNIAGTVTLVGDVDSIGEVSNIVGASVSFVIDGSTIRINVTGAAGYDITWNLNELLTSQITL